ncbi:MAG: hypothetical protein FJW20_23620 [Acidimicrobiia bacterium]|nr:hypothetical protein [Acidimicrobiia bacterium]
MSEWTFAQTDPSQQLAQMQMFSILKQEPEGEQEFIITVREYATPKEPTMKFFALADKQINRKSAPFTPCGWGSSLLDALAECVRSLNKFGVND